ncbi:MAG: hypothetical protein AAF228_12140 [Pseudomonadota bacterium]
MTRELIGLPVEGVPMVDKNGNVTPEWRRQLEIIFEIIQSQANAVDAASGSASGSTVDSEWNTFVNSFRQD